MLPKFKFKECYVIGPDCVLKTQLIQGERYVDCALLKAWHVIRDAFRRDMTLLRPFARCISRPGDILNAELQG